MNLFPPQEILFQGSKERLHRTVTRESGSFVETQQFKILWKCKLAKPLDKLPFWFYCTYENADCGYLITYRITPAVSTVIRMVISFLFACYFAYLAWIRNEVRLIPCLAVFFVVPIVWYTTQLRNCLREFQETFGVITTPRKEHNK